MRYKTLLAAIAAVDCLLLCSMGTGAQSGAAAGVPVPVCTCTDLGSGFSTNTTCSVTNQTCVQAGLLVSDNLPATAAPTPTRARSPAASSGGSIPSPPARPLCV